MLQIYNSLTGKRENFKCKKEIGIYVCGMTVYDYCHIGNARVFIIFDVVVRYLRSLGLKVKYVRNITDIDDKIIRRAKQNNEDYQNLTERFIKILHEDERALSILPPDIEPRATEHMQQIIEFIKKLLAKNYAYISDNGDVYYDITKFQSYGNLAKQDLAELQAGARVAVEEVKRNPLDFVLWKQAKAGEPAWDSPWGKGRPGWHIECSAMAHHYLGENFAIHGGGMDLRFPHHQNEVAQSEAIFGKRMVDFWMHVGFVQVDEQKMAKSAQNFFAVREVLKQYNSETIRYFMLASHYRSPINYTKANLDNAHIALTKLYLALRDSVLSQDIKSPISLKAQKTCSNYEKEFQAAMNDDFNTPEALAVLFSIVKDIHKLCEAKKNSQAEQLGALLKKLSSILGLLQQNPQDFLHAKNTAEQHEIENLIAARNKARQECDWPKADQIREQLRQLGVELEDTAKGTLWRFVTN